MEAEFDSQLKLLRRALRREGFRLIFIRQNRYSIYLDIAAWVRTQFPDRPVLELRIGEEPNYRQFVDAIKAFDRGILLLPDFQKLFREDNHDLRVAFNQRRDLLANLDIAFLCFVEPTGSLSIPKLLPDWWSLRSLEFEFEREEEANDIISPPIGDTLSSIGGETIESKKSEIKRLIEQIKSADPYNYNLLGLINEQLGRIYFDLEKYDSALSLAQKSLQLYTKTGDKRGEAMALNNIGQSYKARKDYDIALAYLEKSLLLFQKIDQKRDESIVLNNIGVLYANEGKASEAVEFLKESLHIKQTINDTKEESVTLNNLGEVSISQKNYNEAISYFEKSLSILKKIKYERGQAYTMNNLGRVYTVLKEFDKASDYLQKSLSIRKEIGDIVGVAATLHNLGTLAYQQSYDYQKAISYLLKSQQINQQVGSSKIFYPNAYLKYIKAEIGEERFNEIVREIEAEETKPETP
jgi:tetratricopeptide (TPR) repeat protein